jgi:hypothetical protein
MDQTEFSLSVKTYNVPKDDHLFPEDKTQTIIFSVVVFVTIQILAELFQILCRNTIECMGRRHYIVKLLVQDVYFILVGVGNVACWRSVWKTIDIILDMVDYDIGLAVMFLTSSVLENRIIYCQIFCDLLLKSAFERIFNVMQLILVKIK